MVRASYCMRALFMVAWVMPGLAVAQSVSIDTGSSWQLADALFELDCASLQVAGSLDAGDGQLAGVGSLSIDGHLAAATATIEVGGDWNNQGSFVAGTGVVQLADRCDTAVAVISGSTPFATLHVDSARGKTYRFAAAQVQSVSSALRLAGAPGAHLVLGSTQAGTQAALALDPGGSQQISWIDVADMVAPEGSAWLASGAPMDFDSVDSGNNTRWFTAATSATPMLVPVDSRWALMLLMLAVLAFARQRMHPH